MDLAHTLIPTCHPLAGPARIHVWTPASLQGETFLVSQLYAMAMAVDQNEVLSLSLPLPLSDLQVAP